MSSKDDKPSPHIRVVAENSKSDIDRERAKRDIEWPLLRLAANIMRVSRGAGDPWEIPVQCADVIKSFHAYNDATGDWPHGEDIKEILSFRDPDLHQYRYRELEDAIETVVSGSLRMAAGRLLGQKLQADHGQKELLQGVDWIERYREERRAQLHWRGGIRAATMRDRRRHHRAPWRPEPRQRCSRQGRHSLSGTLPDRSAKCPMPLPGLHRLRRSPLSSRFFIQPRACA